MRDALSRVLQPRVLLIAAAGITFLLGVIVTARLTGGDEPDGFPVVEGDIAGTELVGPRAGQPGLEAAAALLGGAVTDLGPCDLPGMATACADAADAARAEAHAAAEQARRDAIEQLTGQLQSVAGELGAAAREQAEVLAAAAEEAESGAGAETAGGSDPAGSAGSGGSDSGASGGSAGRAGSSAPAPAANRRGTSGGASIPSEGQLRDVSRPDHVVGDGTPASCTSSALVSAVQQGGVIVFDCGADPVTIRMEETARIRNDGPADVVIDGGGRVTLDGGGARRILYMNTCDQSLTWTTSHCDNQDHPRLTVQNLTFQNAWVGGTDNTAGGAAIFARGGQLTVINSLFRNNRCNPTGPDVGGAAIRAFDQYQDRPLHVVHSTFENNECSNGGALSSIGVSWTITNSVFTGNRAVGRGANPARSGTPGGGNGGAIALDGNRFTLRVRGSVVTDNHGNEGGGGIFFVSNDRTGHLIIEGSTLQRNVSAGFETSGYPGIFYLGDGDPQVSGSTIAR